MNGYQPVALIEKTHGHKGVLLVKPLNEQLDFLSKDGKVILINPDNNEKSEKKIQNIKKYRRGRFLIQLTGLNWMHEVESYCNYVMAV